MHAGRWRIFLATHARWHQPLCTGEFTGLSTCLLPPAWHVRRELWHSLVPPLPTYHSPLPCVPLSTHFSVWGERWGGGEGAGLGGAGLETYFPQILNTMRIQISYTCSRNSAIPISIIFRAGRRLHTRGHTHIHTRTHSHTHTRWEERRNKHTLLCMKRRN